ncbi:hypothetical protein [Anaeromyxobacter terrae]|uniref:hypothetical protein n=1 Tax=Anaeromyxobacter terrae TaxID=2925406 RepID=UPI001F592719|nr:hypothetical protein [Anaeromyxobacter sp. SG22]
MISAATSGSGSPAAPLPSAPADASGRSSALRAAAGAAARGLAELAIETVAPQVAKAARAKTSKSSTAKRSTASHSSSAGYAKTGSTSKSSSSKATAGDPFAFLADPKLSIEEKLMRLLAQLNARYEEEMQQHMNVLAGKASSAGKSGSSGGASGTKKKGGLFGALASVVTKIIPNAGPLIDVLKDKTFQAALKKLGGPVLAAGASALGFPALAPVLMKIGPDLASGAVDLAKALDAETKPSSGGASGSPASSGTADGKGQLSSSEQQLELMKLQQLQEKQKEMFSMVSAIFRMQHETRSSIIGNLR